MKDKNFGFEFTKDINKFIVLRRNIREIRSKLLELKTVNSIYFHFYSFFILFSIYFSILNLMLEINITVTNCYTSVTVIHSYMITCYNRTW